MTRPSKCDRGASQLGNEDNAVKIITEERIAADGTGGDMKDAVRKKISRSPWHRDTDSE